MPFTVTIAGEQALLLSFHCQPTYPILQILNSIALCVKEQTEVTDIVPSFVSLLVVYAGESFCPETEKERLSSITQACCQQSYHKQKPAKIHEIPVCYDEPCALDLVQLSQERHLKTTQIIQLHTQQKYHIYALGFLIGFPFCGFVDERIAQMRKTTPRLSIPAGSVGIAGRQTGIYPSASPGGWNIIGQVSPSFFPKDPIERMKLFSIGDQVRFFAITFSELKEE